MRSQIRKAEKEGVVVRETRYDDDFVRGMTAIFNEAPVRQGRRFWHYGKDFETVKRQFSRYIHREHMIGAYYHDEMIGLIMLGNAGRFGITGQIISSIKHRDKATNNALDREGSRGLREARAGIISSTCSGATTRSASSSGGAASREHACRGITCR